MFTIASVPANFSILGEETVSSLCCLYAAMPTPTQLVEGKNTVVPIIHNKCNVHLHCWNTFICDSEVYTSLSLTLRTEYWLHSTYCLCLLQGKVTWSYDDKTLSHVCGYHSTELYSHKTGSTVYDEFMSLGMVFYPSMKNASNLGKGSQVDLSTGRNSWTSEGYTEW